MPLTTGEPPRDDLVALLRDIQRQIDQLQRRSAFGNTGLSVPGPGVVQVDNLGRLIFQGGSLLMKDTSNRDWLYAGGLATNGFGVSLTRTDGSTALAFTDNDPVNEIPQLIGLYDRGNKALVTEDTSGNGAAWPLAPIVFGNLTWATWSYNTSGSFVAVQSATTYKASPRIYVAGNAICDGSATGEVRLMCNGTQIGSTASIGNLAMTGINFGTPAAVAGTIGTALSLTIETRVTSGSGKCYASVSTGLAWPS